MGARSVATGLLVLVLSAGLAAGKDDEDAEKEFLKALKGKGGPDVHKLVEAAEAMADKPTKEGVKTLIKFGAAIESIDVYLACRNALAAATDGKPREELIKGLLSSKKPEQRVLCADALSGASDAGAVNALVQALDDDDKSVRITAIKGLLRIERKEAIEPLFKRLNKVGFKSADAEAEALFGALHNLTGQAFETLEDWGKWWETVKGDFDPKARARSPENEAVTRTVEGEGKIFDSVVRSQNFVLCLDISSSMRVIDLPSGESWKDAKGKEHDYKDPDPSGAKPPHPDSRFAKSLEAFVKFIEALNGQAKFTIVVFGDAKDTRLWKPKTVQATPGNKKEAIEFVKALKWSYATRTDLALEKAFEVPDIDSIYLYSDGIPEKRQGGGAVDVPQDEILEKARTLNRTRKVKIHCYGMASAKALRDFLAKLASENEGEFKDIRAH